MKDTIKILIIVLAAVLVLAGCKKKETAVDPDAGKIKIVEVDLSTLPLTINPEEFEQRLDNYAIVFPPFPGNIDWSYLNRVRVVIKCYWDDMEEFSPGDGLAVVSLIYDVDGDWGESQMWPGPNTPLKQLNVGGFSGTLHTKIGSRLSVDRAPGMILFQNGIRNVSFIEVTEITFFRVD